MLAPGQGSRTTTVYFPSPVQTPLSQGRETSIEGTLGKQSLFKQGAKQTTGKVIQSEDKKHEFTHGLHCIQHFSYDNPVRFMMYSEIAAAFISLHSDNTACLYTAEGHRQTLSARLGFSGLTDTKISGCLVGWGPGPVFTLLDHELRPLDAATDALDIHLCQPAEHSAELVTAGVGNVCVWSVRLMRCKVKIQEGMSNSVFTHMALAPPRSGRPHRAFALCGKVVTVVDLDVGKVLEHRQDLYSRNINAMVYCSHLDCLITASEQAIRVWDPNWEIRVSFIGHNGEVNSLFYCSGLRMLLSASKDYTIRCWNMEEDDIIDCVHTEPKTPPLCVGGSRKGDAFFSLSQQGVDFWSIRNLYNFHCELKGAPLRQVLVSPCPAPYPIRVLCVSGDSEVTLVTAETGAILTSFRAKQRILCADYCLHKEILLVLTEAGTVIQANTLTNPITLIQEWKGRGQGPWQQRHATDAQNLSVPGPACCLVIYSCVAETQRALEEWRSLQERRGCSHRNQASLNDAKNKFLIILGQNGGCVSVLTLDNGKVLYRTSAHDGQKVTALKVYPEDNCLLSTGEDLTVAVWRVHPYAQDCLSQLMSLHCGQPQVHLPALGPQLALTFQEPNSGTHSLMHFNLLNQSWTGQPPAEGHLDDFTGLCVCPDLEVFVSSSLDGTLHIWDEENHLIRILHLNAVPECLAYGGFGGELFLGIKGDLYKIDCAKFLPQEYQQMLLYTYWTERLPDSPIIVDKKKCIKKKTAPSAKNMEEESKTVATSQSMTSDMWRQKEYERLLASNMDLSDLLQGTAKSRKEKPPSTIKTKKEAFDHYMKIIYGLPCNIKIDFEDSSDEDTFSFRRKPEYHKPYSRPPSKEKKVDPEPELIIPVIVKKKKVKKAPAPSPEPPPPVKVKPQIVERVTPRTPIIVEKKEEPPEIIPPIEKPKPKPKPPASPAPRPPRPPRPKTPEIRPPSPEMPSFLKQFADADWFKDLFPDKKRIPSTLSPEQFSLQLLGYLNTCRAQSRMKVLAALQALHRQGLLENKDKLYHGLIDLVPKFVRPQMAASERSVFVEMMNLLMRLKSASYEFVKKLLTLLAFRKLALRDIVLRMLTTLGVDEAEQWLWPELKSWDKELQDQSDIWKSLHDRADGWLDLWISKYKDHDRYLRSTETWKPPSFGVVDVLNYFCSVREEEHRKARVAPVGPNNTVLLPLCDCSSEPIIRLGETYSMARIRRPPGIVLPPLRNRPFLTHFPSLITFPMSHVTLSPFRTYSEEDWHKILPRRYFIQEQSLVEYYR